MDNATNNPWEQPDTSATPSPWGQPEAPASPWGQPITPPVASSWGQSAASSAPPSWGQPEAPAPWNQPVTPPAASPWGQAGAPQMGNNGASNAPSSFTPWLHNSQAQQGGSGWGSFASPASAPLQPQTQQPAPGWGSFPVNPASQPQPQPPMQQPASDWNGASNQAFAPSQPLTQQPASGWNGFANQASAPSQSPMQQTPGNWSGLLSQPSAPSQQPSQNWGPFANQAGTQMHPQTPHETTGWGAFANAASGPMAQPQQQMPQAIGNNLYGYGGFAPPQEGNREPAPGWSEPSQKRKAKGKASKKRRFITIGIVAVLLVAMLGGGAFIYRTLKHMHPALTALTPIQDISLGNGPPTRFDYQSMDPANNLLLISRSGANSVLLVNLQTRQVLAEIPGIADGHGLYAVDDVGRIYAAAGGSDQVVVIDLHTYHIITRINVGKGAGPDGMAYDPAEHLLFVSDETGNNDAVINVQTDKLVTFIPLGGNVGNTQYDPATDTIYVNVETKNQVAAINPKTLKVTGTYPLAGCTTNHGMSIDSVNRLMFIACTGNATLVEVNMQTMQVTDHASIGNNPDVLALDQSRHILYVASESGVVSIFMEQGQTVHKLAEGYIAPHAHTVGVDQQTHLVYLPLENLNGHPVIRIAQFNPPAGS